MKDAYYNQNNFINNIIDSIGVTLIGLYALGSLLFRRNFAQLRLEFSFLQFPLFIGEILLLACSILFVFKCIINYQKSATRIFPLKVFFKKYWIYLLLFIYYIFISIKTLAVIKWGPLALRHAALFYYSLFAVFGYTFYRSSFYDRKKTLRLSLLLIIIIKFINIFNAYFLLISIILASVLIKGYPKKPTRYLLFLLLFVCIPYQELFSIKKAMLISNIIVIIYLAIASILIVRIKARWKSVLVILSILLVFVMAVKMGDKYKTKVFMDFEGLKEIYNRYNKKILDNKDQFIMTNIKKVELFSSDEDSIPLFKIFKIKSSEEESSASKYAYTLPQPKFQLPQTKMQLRINIRQQRRMLNEISKEIPPEEQLSLPKQQPTFSTAEAIDRAVLDYHLLSFIFRILIWRDVITDLIKERPLFGFDFGKPFRSKNIEVIGCSTGQWLRDGWISMHNVYLDIIYRTGIVGIFFILSIFIILFKMIKKAMTTKSLTIILLCGIFINILVFTAFAEVLELPYNAIPFWALFGMTWRYVTLRGQKLETKG